MSSDRLKRQAERLAEILTRKEYEPLLRSLPLVAPRTPLDAQLSAAAAAACPSDCISWADVKPPAGRGERRAGR